MSGSVSTPLQFPLSRSEIQSVLEAKGIRLRKEWGQNLLTDHNMLAAIIRDSGVGPTDLVLEIGPGAGSLTYGLVQHAGLVISVDIDRGMLDVTRQLLEGVDNLVTVRADVMGAHNQLNPVVADIVGRALGRLDSESMRDADDVTVTFPEGWSFPAGGRLRVVANLPYSISSPVLLALLESSLPIADMTLMLQLEVAQKLCAKPGSDTWGILAILAGVQAESSILRRVPAQCFWPRPKVDSAVVRVVPSPDRVNPDEYTRLKRVVHGLFQQRRKTILNGARIGLRMDTQAARHWLATAGVEESEHAERLDMDALWRLARALQPEGTSEAAS